MNDQNGASRRLSVFAIIERKDASKPAFWLKVGSAFTNRDGSLTLYLDAFPIATNKLHVRESRPSEDARARGDGEGKAKDHLAAGAP